MFELELGDGMRGAADGQSAGDRWERRNEYEGCCGMQLREGVSQSGRTCVEQIGNFDRGEFFEVVPAGRVADQAGGAGCEGSGDLIGVSDLRGSALVLKEWDEGNEGCAG